MGFSPPKVKLLVTSLLMNVLRRRFGIDGSALSWVAEFLSSRRQLVYAGKSLYSQIYKIRWNNAKYRPLRRSRSFKVTTVGTNRKPVCDFLRMNDSNLYYNSTVKLVGVGLCELASAHNHSVVTFDGVFQNGQRCWCVVVEQNVYTRVLSRITERNIVYYQVEFLLFR